MELGGTGGRAFNGVVGGGGGTGLRRGLSASQPALLFK